MLRLLLVFTILVSGYQVSFTQAEQEIFLIVQEQPRFPGCEHLDISAKEKSTCSKELLYDYIYDNLEYPDDAVKFRTEGQVIYQFIVDTLGHISEIEAIEEIGDGTTEAGRKVIESFNDLNVKWRPGYNFGTPVMTRYKLGIKFEL